MHRIAAFTAAACAALAVASSAASQDLGSITGMFAAGGDSFGQGLGQSIVGADSIFVYAQGRAGTPAKAGQSFSFSIQSKAETAVEAAKLRDAKIDRLRAAAARFGAGFEVADTTYTLGQGDTVAFGLSAIESGEPEGEASAKPGFTTRASIRVTQVDAAKAPALLDALRAAGADAISTENEVGNLFARRAASWLGALEPQATSPEVWNAAADDAVREARAQAERLAKAAGRDLGAARQITFLARSSDGDTATVTVAVRFALAPAR